MGSMNDRNAVALIQQIYAFHLDFLIMLLALALKVEQITQKCFCV